MKKIVEFIGIVTTIVFIILKLTDLIDWSWWWIFSPIWIPVGAGILMLPITIPMMRKK
jgi:hypothetical protein